MTRGLRKLPEGPSGNNVTRGKAFHQFMKLLQWQSREQLLKALSVQEVLLPVVSQPFGVKMYKSKTLLLQIADNFIEMPVGGGTIIVEYQ